MSLYDPSTEHPDEYVAEGGLPLPKRVQKAVQALEENRGPIHRWFWKGLFAFNLLWWSVLFPLALCIAFVRSLP